MNIERHGPDHVFLDQQKYHLIGDSAFGIKTWLMKPYEGKNLTRKQKNHNYRLSSSRVKIEHSFGLLKGRWRRLQFINTYNICKTIEISTAGCILHNFCILHNDFWEEEYEDKDKMNRRTYQQDDIEGRAKRDLIANKLFNVLNV